MATVGPPIASSAITTPAKTLGAAECPLPIGDSAWYQWWLANRD
ncbi:hypothetical protein PC116_g2034 [Phytophthora cactorum]|nr:hypothetical protein PC116_g2034 [Phytophthora cactorum]